MGGTRWIWLALAVVAATASVGESATYHVSPFGSNTPPYDSYVTAATHPADANALATAYGDTVLIHAGEYLLTFAIEVDSGVAWVGVHSDSAVLKWVGSTQPPVYMVEGVGANVFSSICFRNPNPQGVSSLSGLLLQTGSPSSAVTGCRFYACSIEKGNIPFVEVCGSQFDVFIGWGVLVIGQGETYIHDNYFISGEAGAGTGSGVYAGSGLVQIERNVFDYRPAEGRGEPIYVDRFPHAIVRNNLIFGGRQGVLWVESSGLIENNTILGPQGMTPQGDELPAIEGDLTDTDTLVIRNNCFANSSAVPFLYNECPTCPPSGPITYVHNAFWPPVASSYETYPAAKLTITDSSNFVGFPMFADDSLYTLQAGSPLIDAGDPTLLDSDLSRSDIGWTGGPGGIIADYPEMPPAPPDSVGASGTDGIVTIQWAARPEADLAGYNLYRGDVPGFSWPGMQPLKSLGPGETQSSDTILTAGQTVYYVVTAFDTAGMASPASDEVSYSVTSVTGGGDELMLPRSSILRRVYPNPLNAGGVFEVYLTEQVASKGLVQVEVFDLLGRVVARPVSQALPAGASTLSWAAVDDRGRPLASGVYFAQLRVRGEAFGQARKFVILR